MPDHKSKSSSVVRSISKQLTKIASSTSNSNNCDDENVMAKVATATIIADDVPLNKKARVVEKSKTNSATATATAKSRTTVVGSSDLKLKVSHNDAGRVVISVSSPEKILVQVHVDESVLKKKGGTATSSSSIALKKKKKAKTSSASTIKASKEDKDRPKKKSNTLVKKSSTKKMSSGSGGSSNKRRSKEPRDLPEELSSLATRGRDREKSKSNRASSRSRSRSVEPSTTKKKKPAATVKNFTAHFSSIMSVASGVSKEGAASHCSEGSDDSTRSPLDLNRCNTAVVAPKTPTTKQIMEKWGCAPPQGVVDTPSTEPDMMMMDTDFATTPTWDRRRQKMILKRQNSKIMIDDPPYPGTHPTTNTGTEAKMEVTANDPQQEPEDNDDDELSIFSSPLQQRRLQHRQKRLEKQKAEGEEIFRSTRSIRSAHSNISNPLPPLPTTAIPGATAGDNNSSDATAPSPSIELDASTNATPASFRPLMPDKNTQASISDSTKSSGNRARHTRSHHIPHDDDDDDSATCNTRGRRIITGGSQASSTIQQTIDNVRKVELVNKGDRFSGRSSFRKKEHGGEHEKLPLGSKTGSNLFTKICDKVCNSNKNKRQRKDHHQKLL